MTNRMDIPEDEDGVDRVFDRYNKNASAVQKNEYTEIKVQIKFVTGKYEIICPACKQSASASVSGAHRVCGRITRKVSTTCRHCHTSYSFQWK